MLSSLTDRIVLLSGTEGVSYKPIQNANGNGSAIEVKTSFHESISSSAETSEGADNYRSLNESDATLAVVR